MEQFESDPDKNIERLELHLKKLGMDAVGYFVLALMYHKTGNTMLANQNALKAKCYAPGSPLFSNLHYFLLHPQKFDAKVPAQHTYSSTIPNQKNDFDINLDSLISKLSAADTLKVQLPSHLTDVHTDLSLPAQMVGDIASETLALIYEKQGKFNEAIEALQILQKVRPKQAGKYQDDIIRLENLSKMGEEDKEKKK